MSPIIEEGGVKFHWPESAVDKLRAAGRHKAADELEADCCISKPAFKPIEFYIDPLILLKSQRITLTAHWHFYENDL